MARGVKKSLQEKIAQKEELIEALSTRIKKEREEKVLWKASGGTFFMRKPVQRKYAN